MEIGVVVLRRACWGSGNDQSLL